MEATEDAQRIGADKVSFVDANDEEFADLILTMMDEAWEDYRDAQRIGADKVSFVDANVDQTLEQIWDEEFAEILQTTMDEAWEDYSVAAEVPPPPGSGVGINEEKHALGMEEWGKKWKELRKSLISY